MATGKKTAFRLQEEAKKAAKIQSEANSLANENIEITDQSYKLDKAMLEVTKQIHAEQMLIQDLALKAVKSRKDGLNDQANYHKTQMDLAKLAKKALEDEKKLTKFKLDQQDSIDRVLELEKKINKQREHSKNIAEDILKPFKLITDRLRNIPIVGKALEPFIKGLEDKFTDVAASLFNKKSVSQLQEQLSNAKKPLEDMANKSGVKLDEILGKSGKSANMAAVGAEDMAGGIGEAGAAAEGMGASLAAALGPIGLIVIAAAAIGYGIYKAVKHANELRDAVIDTARNQGLSAAAALKYEQSINRAARDSGKYGLNLVGSVKEMKELNTGFNDIFESNLKLTNNNTQLGTYLIKNMNLSTKEANDFLQATALTGDQMDVNVLTTQKQVEAINKGTNMGLRMADVMKKIGSASATILANYHNNIPELVKNISILTKYGKTWETAQKSADLILNIEQSIADEMEARVLTGKNINLNQARYLALTGDTVGALNNMLQQIGSYADIEKMLPIQREKLGKAIGMTGDELLMSLKRQQQLGQLTGTQIEDLNKLNWSQIQAGEGVSRGLSQEQINAELAARSQIKASELTQTAMAKMSLMADALIYKTVGGTLANESYQRAGLNNEVYNPSEARGYGHGRDVDEMGDPVPALKGTSLGLGAAHDFISRPGQGVMKFDRDDIIIGATNPFGQGKTAQTGDSELVSLLKVLIQKVDQPVYLNIGGKVIDELDSRITLRKSYNTKVDSGYNAFG